MGKFREQTGYAVDTGQEVTVLIESGGTKPSARFSDPYTYVFPQGWQRMLTSDLTGTDLRVFAALQLIAPVGGGRFDSAPGPITELTGYDERRIRRSIAALIEAGLILRPKRGWLAHAPRVTWRGLAVQREALKAGTTEEN